MYDWLIQNIETVDENIIEAAMGNFSSELRGKLKPREENLSSLKKFIELGEDSTNCAVKLEMIRKEIGPLEEKFCERGRTIYAGKLTVDEEKKNSDERKEIKIRWDKLKLELQALERIEKCASTLESEIVSARKTVEKLEQEIARVRGDIETMYSNQSPTRNECVKKYLQEFGKNTAVYGGDVRKKIVKFIINFTIIFSFNSRNQF